jgi:aminoglycoside phosphotransferase (APT) family kinase protein
MPAGASNETVGIDLRFTCDGVNFDVPLILRPQRSDGILAPYDVGRQFRVMRALAKTAVPVPPVLCYEPGGSILGAPFFLMARVTGETLPLFWYGGQSPRLAAAAGALAAIHAVDWRGARLDFLLPPGADLGTPPTPLECELQTWRARAANAGLGADRLLVALAAYLAENEPSDARHALLHGDPNPGNYLLQEDRVVAVVDWELAAIGDPRSDLGFYAALQTVFGGGSGRSGHSVLSDAYEGITGTPLSNLDYYEAFGLYRMAVVMAGWASRLGGFGFYGMDVITHRLDELFGPRWAA